MEKKIYEKPNLVVIDLAPMDRLLGVSIPKGEDTPPGTAEARMFTDIDLDDEDFEDEENNVATWGINRNV